jgi:hypothetical protein
VLKSISDSGNNDTCPRQFPVRDPDSVCVKLWGAVNEIPLSGGVAIASGRGGLIPLYGGAAEGRGG